MSLVTVARYRAITGDTATTASTVTARIEDAVDLLEEVLDRPLESAERTEALTPTRDGKLWPRAVPVTDPGDYTVDGLALKGGMFGSTTFTVTYTGGWVEPSADPSATNRLPVCIEEDLAWAAHALIHPGPGLDVPAGATSVQLGDVSVSFRGGAPGVNRSGIRWSRRTLAYRYRVTRSV
ncbi:MAG: hypothetical protein IPM43_01825 [Actinomycetota bacterium]|nr:MAG: hypothetical protein IPM43_01825 [Actinomycetota bacterium]